nr:MFS transporter [Isoptericola chiayiensis]
MHRRIWLVAALGLMLDGFDFFVIGVCLPLIAAELAPSELETGLIASSAVVGSVFGALLGGILADRIGRRTMFRLDLVLFVLAALACALAWDVWSLILFRFVLGLAIGADYPLSSSYAAEVAPRRSRRRLLVGVISFQAVGSLLGVGLGLAILDLDPSEGAWRWILGSGAVLAFAVVLARIGVPESPQWLLAQGERTEAADVVSRLVGRPVAADDLSPPPPAEQVSQRELFTAGLRRLTLVTSVPWFLLDVVVYGVGVFTPTVLAAVATADADSTVGATVTSLRQTAVTDVFLVLGFAVALVLIYRVGMIRLQVVGFVGIAAGLGTLALAAALPGGVAAYTWLAFAGFAASNFFQNAGPNSTTFVLPAMVFPTRVRATGAGFAAAAGKAGAVVVTFAFPLLEEWWGLAVTVGVMAAGALVAAVVTVVARPRESQMSDR